MKKKEIKINTVMEKLRSYFQDNYNLTFMEKMLEFPIIDFLKWDLYSAEYIISNPSQLQPLFNLAFETEYEENDYKMPIIKIINVPKDKERQINRLRKKNFEELIILKGVVISRTKVHPRVAMGKFECPSCGEILNVQQMDDFFKEPMHCGCGRKGKFKLIEKEYDDVLIMQIEELPEMLKSSEIPYNIYCILKNGIIGKEHSIFLGARVELVGYLTELTKIKNRCKMNSCDFLFNVLSYSNLEEIEFDDTISAKETELFELIANHHNPAALISKWIYSDIYGYKKAKEICVYQQFGGTTYNGRRDFIHVLLFGSPGSAKSDLAFKTSLINPITKIATGTHSSGVGLTAAVEKDELSGKFIAKGGLLARCNNGLAVIDEIEKMSENDKKSLHMPMESGYFSIEKAGISAKMVSKTSILATSNEKVVSNGPKVVTNTSKVVDLPEPIIDRFDFLLHFKDTIDARRDEKIATLITDRATFEGNDTTFGQNQTTFEALDTTFPIYTLRKYIYICKKRHPKLSRRVKKQCHSWYLELRQCSKSVGWDTKIPTPRALESIFRLSRAICRCKNKDVISIKELKIAIMYFDFMYKTDLYKKSEIIDVE